MSKLKLALTSVKIILLDMFMMQFQQSKLDGFNNAIWTLMERNVVVLTSEEMTSYIDK